jgi:hypothetical protein
MKSNPGGLQNLQNVRKYTTETREMFHQVVTKYVEMLA